MGGWVASGLRLGLVRGYLPLHKLPAAFLGMDCNTAVKAMLWESVDQVRRPLIGRPPAVGGRRGGLARGLRRNTRGLAGCG